MDILTSYSFQIVAIGTLILAVTSGAVGCLSVLKGQSLIGDSIGHASFPGVIISFMLFQSRNPWILLLGAIIAGAIAYYFITLVRSSTKLELDVALAIILSSAFGLGMVLKSHISGNPDYRHVAQSGLAHYIFGQAAYISKEEVGLIFTISIPIIIILLLFIKEFKVYLFDETYAKVYGFKSGILNSLLLIMMITLISTGLKLVGAILISSLLIAPAIIALQWSNKFRNVLIISSLSGGICAVIGTALSSTIKGFSTGPSIIVVLSIVALISLLISPNGLIQKVIKRKKLIARNCK